MTTTKLDGLGTNTGPTLLEALAEANRRLEEANARMRGELEAATRVQQALLPSPEFQAPGLNLGWRLRPCAELAGDLLNCIRLDENHIAFFVLDVSGHGVASALLSVQISRMMSPLMSQSSVLKKPLREPPWYQLVEPRGVVEQLNRSFQMSSDLTQYFTILYGLLDLTSRQLRFVSAGHPGPIHVPADGEPIQFPCHSNPVGFFDDAQFDAHELTLKPGDRFWVYSDGITEAMDPQERELGAAGLMEQVGGMGHLSVDETVDRAMASVEDWCRPESPRDDCTLLVIEACETKIGSLPGPTGGRRSDD